MLSPSPEGGVLAPAGDRAKDESELQAGSEAAAVWAGEMSASGCQPAGKPGQVGDDKDLESRRNGRTVWRTGSKNPY